MRAALPPFRGVGSHPLWGESELGRTREGGPREGATLTGPTQFRARNLRPSRGKPVRDASSVGFLRPSERKVRSVRSLITERPSRGAPSLLASTIKLVFANRGDGAKRRVSDFCRSTPLKSDLSADKSDFRSLTREGR